MSETKRVPFPDDDTVARLIWNRTATLADKPYVRFHSEGSWKWLTWGEYGERVKQVAHGLMSLGIEPGQVAGIVSQTRLEWGIADLGILSAGGVTVTVYPTLLAEDVAYILGHSDARLVFLENTEQLDKVLARKSDLPDLEHIVLIEGDADDAAGAITFADLLARGRAHAERNPGAWKQRIEAAKPGDLATLVYTSGTTGPPKGAMISHSNFIETCRGLEKLGLVTPDDHSISYLPLCHIYERISTYMYGIYAGATTGIARGMDTLVDDIRVIAPSIMVGVPRVYEKIHAGMLKNLSTQSAFAQRAFHWAIGVGRAVRKCKDEKRPIPPLLALQHRLADKMVYGKIRARFGGNLRLLVSAAAPIASEILDFFDALGIPIVEGYGMTECTGPATLSSLEETRIGYVGKALDGLQIRIADDGEILIKGYNVLMGYYKNPEGTAETLEDGWLHTGDIGELTGDGYLKITDRKKDIIITAGGKNIAPQNIENLIKMDPYISEALVHGDGRKYLSALLTLDEAMLLEWAKEKGLGGVPFETLVEKKEVVDLVTERMAAVNGGLARFESIKKFRILPKQFTIEDGEVTPTMKLKRKKVTAKYRDILDEMYAEG